MVKGRKEKELPALPHSLEAEQSVIGSIILNDKVLVEVIDQLDFKDFYSGNHKTIYEAIQGLYEDKKAIDLVTLTNKLRGSENLEKIGGASYLTSLTSDLPTTSNIKGHIQIVKDKASLRELIDLSYKAIEEAEEGKEAGDILANANQRLSKLSQQSIGDDFPNPQELVERFRKDFDYRIDNKIKYRWISSGFDDLDRHTSGFGKGDFIVIGAVTKMGKTSLMLDIATRLKEKSLYLTYEMSEEQILARLLAKFSGVEIGKITQSTANEKEIKAIHKALGQYYNERKIFIRYAPNLDLFKVKTLIKRIKAKEDIKLVFVDYLQLVPNVRRGRQRYEEVSGTARELKNLAGELGVVIIAGAQLDANLGLDNKPRINSIRESKAPEHEADSLIFIHREGFFNPKVTHNRAEIIVKLTRHGRPGSFYLEFDERTLSFKEVSYENI